MTRLLIASFSTLVRDARLLRQINLFSATHEVTTLGYGPAPDGVVDHLRLDDSATNNLDGRLITARAYRVAYWVQKGVRQARKLLAGREFDVVLANDMDMLPLAAAVPARGFHADLHEYFPLRYEDNEAWMRRIRPYNLSILSRYLPKAASVTTVGQRLADLYSKEFGVEVGVVTNASPAKEWEPGEVGPTIRLVHSGAARSNRHLELMVDAMSMISRDDIILDMYLTRNEPAYIDDLRSKKVPGVTIHDPLPYADLVDRLHTYDCGVFILPPVNTSYRYALPNKLFDFVQARLGSIVSPNEEMAEMVDRYGLGVVTKDFTADSLAEVLDSLDRSQIATWKANAHRHATELSGEVSAQGWADHIERIGL